MAVQPNPKHSLDAYECVLWNWVNVYNLDTFLQEMYVYYHGKGIYSISLKRTLNPLWVPPLYVCQWFANTWPKTVGFVIAFSTFALRCVDYSRIP